MNPRLVAIALVLGMLCAPVCYALNGLPRLLHSLFDIPFWVWPVLVSPVTEEVCKAFALMLFWSITFDKIGRLPRVWLWLGLFLGFGFGLTEAGLSAYFRAWSQLDLIIRGVVIIFIHGVPVSLVGLFMALHGWRGWGLALAVAVIWHGLWNASMVFSTGSGMISPLGFALFFALLGTGVFVLPLYLTGSIFRPNRDVRKCDEQ